MKHLCNQRQRKKECTPLVRRTLDPDHPAMTFDDFFTNRQPQPTTHLQGITAGIKSFENHRQVFCGNPNSLVNHFDPPFVVH